MALFLLDTDTVSLWQRGHPKVVAHVTLHSPSELAIAIISVEEQFLGRISVIRKQKVPAELANAYQSFATSVFWLRNLEIQTYSEPAVFRFKDLRNLKLNVGSNDLRIAAIALEAGATVVTRILQDFGRVPGLTAVDWSA